MAFDDELNKASKRLVWLLELELARRLDLETWLPILGHVYTTDAGNNRIKDLRDDNLSYRQQFGSAGAGNDQFQYPWGIATDGVYLYITDRDNSRLKKHNARTLAYVAKIGSLGAGNDNFNAPLEICVAGEHVFVVDQNNSRVVKRKRSDLSYVGVYDGSAIAADHTLITPTGVCFDGTYVWVLSTGGRYITHKFDPTTLAPVTHYHWTVGTGDAQFNNPHSMDSDGTYLYIYDQNNNRIKKHLCSDFSFVAKWGSWLGSCGTSGLSLGTGTGCAYRHNALYLTEGTCQRVRKHLSSDLSLVCVNGHFGAPTDGNDYDVPRGMETLDVVSFYFDLGLARGKPTRFRAVDRTTGEVSELAEESSSEEVEWTPGSWYFDEATGLLYIHLPDDSHPEEEHYYFAVYFWRRFCDGQYPAPDEVVFDGHWYEPRLKRDSIPDFTQEISGFDQGGIRQTWGPLKLENADGALDLELVDDVWEAKIYELKVGARGGAYADFRTVSRGRTGSITWEEGEITINAEDPLKAED